jgi:excisionase family DNA binding protein
MYKLEENGKLAYSIPEVAKLTGLSVSYLYKLSASGILPVSKIGARVIVISSDLHTFLREHSRANVIINQKHKLGGNEE